MSSNDSATEQVKDVWDPNNRPARRNAVAKAILDMSEEELLSVVAQPREKVDLSQFNYAERHILRHLRHEQEKELEKRAWKYCDDFTKVLQKCLKDEGFMGPLRCQEPLKSLKICMNRFAVSQREQSPPVNDIPKKDNLIKPEERW